MTATAYGALGPVITEPKKKIRYIIERRSFLGQTGPVKLTLFKKPRKIELSSYSDALYFATKFRLRIIASFWCWMLNNMIGDFFADYKVVRIYLFANEG